MDILNILVVSDNMKYIKDLIQVIKSNLECNITAAFTLGEAKSKLTAQDFAIVICYNGESIDDSITLALTATEKETTEVIMIVDSSMQEKINRCVEPHGVFVIPKPISINLFQTVLRLAVAARKKVVKLNDDNISLLNKLDDIKVVNRAKCCLIQYLGITENEAHRYIEKKAMDMRKSRKSVAQEILKTYEI